MKHSSELTYPVPRIVFKEKKFSKNWIPGSKKMHTKKEKKIPWLALALALVHNKEVNLFFYVHYTKPNGKTNLMKLNKCDPLSFMLVKP